MEGDILTHFEAEHVIQSLEIVPVEDYASPKWFRQHENIHKLNIQSHRNAKAREDEYVMDLVCTYDKVRVLIYDLIASEVWKSNILPILKSHIYHEGVVANFLEVMLYHRTVCEEAKDELLDLIDWCYRKIMILTRDRPERCVTEISKEEELEFQIKELDFAMGICSISMIRFITDHLESLNLAVIQQLVEQCDILCVLIPLMESKPWFKDSKSSKLLYEDSYWQPYKDSSKMPKIEAQIWLTVYNLFMNPDVRNKYELNSFRKNNLLRLRKYLNEVTIDQLPVLSNLLRALEEISLIGDSSSSRISAFLIQQLPEIRDNLIRNKNWHEIACRQRETFLIENEETRKADMQLLMAGLEDFLEDPICAKCGNLATYRCSKCHNEWYCSRECQKSAWKQHKLICHLIKLDEPDAPKKKAEAPKVRIEDITKS